MSIGTEDIVSKNASPFNEGTPSSLYSGPISCVLSIKHKYLDIFEMLNAFYWFSVIVQMNYHNSLLAYFQPLSLYDVQFESHLPGVVGN